MINNFNQQPNIEQTNVDEVAKLTGHSSIDATIHQYRQAISQNAKDNEALIEEDKPKSPCDIWTEKSKRNAFNEITQEEFNYHVVYPSGKELYMYDWLKAKVDNWRFTNGKMPFGGDEFLLTKGKWGNKSNYHLYQEMKQEGVLEKVLDSSDMDFKIIEEKNLF